MLRVRQFAAADTPLNSSSELSLFGLALATLHIDYCFLLGCPVGACLLLYLYHSILLRSLYRGYFRFWTGGGGEIVLGCFSALQCRY